MFYLKIGRLVYASLPFLFFVSGSPDVYGASYSVVESFQQKNQKVSGTVLDESGMPIIGANVIVKEAPGVGVITDLDGNFSLTIPENGKTLLVSFIGYAEKEVKIKDSGMLKIVLSEDAKMLEEVQVIAYGTQSKVSVTGSMSSVRTEDLLKVPNASLTNALAGSMTGVAAVQSVGQPGMEDANLYIRGSSTLSQDGSDAPLVLVDGIERPFSQIDPNEVADITVLKDASATAVFGVRGANGVILVTTRRGEKGKAKISVSSNVSIQMPTRLLENCDSYHTALLYNEKLDNDHSSAARFSDYALEAYRTGSDPVIYPNTNWRELIFKNTYIQTQHNVTISGGTDRVRYFTSLGYLYQDGMLKQFDTLDYDNQYSYNRFNYRANLDIDVTKTTLFKINIGGRLGITHEPKGHSDGLWRQVNWSQPFSGPGLSEDGYPISVGTSYVPLPIKNGFDSFYGLGYNQKSKNDLNMDISIEQKLDCITKGLKVHVKGSYNTYYTMTVQRSGNRQKYVAYYEGSLTNPGMDMSDPNFSKNIVYQVNGQNKNLEYGESFARERNWYLEGGINYNRTFKNVHRVSGLLLYNQNRVYYPKAANGNAMDYQYIPRSYVGLVGRASYGYNSRYLFDVNVGYNGSENFAPGKTRFGVFPSGSIGWVISEENFMKNQSLISFLKLRASYGIVGNDKIGVDRFLYMDGVWSVDGGGYNFGIDQTSKDPAATEGQLGNPVITWEKSAKQNYGVDLKMLEDRLSISADYFRENRTDILITRNTAPGVIAIALPKQNMGEVMNQGYELSIKWADKFKDFRYWVNANVSYAKNKIIYMDEVKHVNDFNNQTGRSTGLTYGYVFDRFYTAEDFADVDKGILKDDLPVVTIGTPFPGDCKYVDMDNNGKIDANDRTYLGYSTQRPEYVFGFDYGFNWKGWDFSMQWTGATHVSRNLETEYRIPFSPNGKRALLQFHADERWTEETAATATMPRFSDNSKSLNYDVNSSLWVRDASYIRLKNIQLGYTFRNSPFLKKLGLSNVNLYVSGYNVLTFDKLKFVDPEAPTNGGNSNQYPISKMYTMGLKLNF